MWRVDDPEKHRFSATAHVHVTLRSRFCTPTFVLCTLRWAICVTQGADSCYRWGALYFLSASHSPAAHQSLKRQGQQSCGTCPPLSYTSVEISETWQPLSYAQSPVCLNNTQSCHYETLAPRVKAIIDRWNNPTMHDTPSLKSLQSLEWKQPRLKSCTWMYDTIPCWNIICIVVGSWLYNALVAEKGSLY